MSVLAVKFQTNGVNYKVVLHEISFHPVTILSLIIQDNVRSVIMLPRFLQSVKVIILNRILVFADTFYKKVT